MRMRFSKVLPVKMSLTAHRFEYLQPDSTWGFFDEKEIVPYSKLGQECMCSNLMKDVDVDMANDTIVVLKNNKKFLPINKVK